MIKKFIFGNPIETEAVVGEVSVGSSLPYFSVNERFEFSYEMGASDVVYGLGEQVRGINKRGWQYLGWNYDNPNHQEDTRSLYGSHNFLLIKGR